MFGVINKNAEIIATDAALVSKLLTSTKLEN